MTSDESFNLSKPQPVLLNKRQNDSLWGGLNGIMCDVPGLRFMLRVITAMFWDVFSVCKMVPMSTSLSYWGIN